jgi:putative membrane protein
MYTGRVYPLKQVFIWTWRDLVLFILIALIPVVLYTFLDFKFLRLPWLPIALVGTAVAFIIGFKNNASYDRLWEARKIWGGIVNSSRSFAMLTNDLITNEYAENPVSEQELQTIRQRLVNRHIAWMAAHRYGLRQTRPWEQFLENRSNQEYSKRHPIPESRQSFEEEVANLLSNEDLQFLKGKTNKATQLLNLQSKDLKEIKQRGLIWEFSYLEMENLLVEFYTLQGKNERIKNFPYPRQFATLNFFFVWIFILLLPIGLAGEFEGMGLKMLEYADQVSEGVRGIYKAVATTFIWLTVPFSAIISGVFHTMERVGEVSENPFEGTANDVPITSMARGIEIDMLEMIGAETIPEPIPSEHNIQM